LTFQFFVPPNHPSVETTQVGAFSRVSFEASHHPRHLESDSRVSRTDLSESRFCNATIRGDGWEIGARWIPAIADMIIDGRVGQECGYRYRLLDRSPFPDPIACEAVQTASGRFDVTFQEIEVDVDQEPTFDLVPLVRSALEAGRFETAKLRATSGEATIEWTIDASPVVNGFAYDVTSEINGLIHILVDLRVASLVPTRLTLEIVSGPLISFSTPFTTAPDMAYEHSSSHAAHLARPTIGDAAMEIRVCWHDRVLHALPLILPPPPDAPADRQAFSALIRSYRETGATAYLIELLLRYLEEFRQAQCTLPAKQLAAQIATGANPECETCVAVSLKVLTTLASGAGSYVPFPSLTRVDRLLGTLTASIWLLMSRRLAVSGQLLPREFEEAVLVARTPATGADARIAEIADVASSVAERVLRTEQPPTAVELDRPMAMPADAASRMRRCIQENFPELRNLLENEK